MKTKIFTVVVLTLVSSVLGSLAFAQTRTNISPTADKYMISAKAGGINFTEGEISVMRSNGHSGVLLNRDQIEVGDRVSTGASGKIEVLLNPGSYMRVGANSAFEFKTTSLDDLHIRVDRGYALFEVFAADEFRVTIETPKGAVALIDTGIYKVDVASDGRATIAVYDGAAQIGDVNLTIIKKGKTAVIARNNIVVSKFDRSEKGELGEWSKSRSKELAKMTSSLKSPGMRDSLLSSFNGGDWNLFNSFGLWVYNPFGRSYCFLPFGQGWYSPYGYGYGTNLWWYNLPPTVIDPNARRPRPGNPTSPVDPPVTTDRQRGTSRSADADLPFKTMDRNREPRQPAFDPFERDTTRPIRVPETPITATPPTPAPVNTDRKKDN